MKEHFWRKRANERRQKILDLVENPQYRNILNNEFFEALAERQKWYSSRSQKVQALQATVALLLLFALLVPDARLSFIGIAIEAKSLREALLLISAAVQSTGYFYYSDELYNREFIEARIRSVGKTDDELKRALRLRFWLTAGPYIPRVDIKAMTGSNMLIYLLSGISFLLWILLSFLGLVGIHFAAVVSILRHPNISLTVSVLIALYVIVVDVMMYGFQFMSQSTLPFDEGETKGVENPPL
jgi:hypothetical protein